MKPALEKNDDDVPSFHYRLRSASAPAICLMNLVRPDYMPTAWQLRAVECSLS